MPCENGRVDIGSRVRFRQQNGWVTGLVSELHDDGYTAVTLDTNINGKKGSVRAFNAEDLFCLDKPIKNGIGRQETRLPLALASVTLGSGANLRGTAAGACRRVRGPAGGHAFRARPTSRRSLRESDAQGPWERTAVALILSVSPFPSSCC